MKFFARLAGFFFVAEQTSLCLAGGKPGGQVSCHSAQLNCLMRKPVFGFQTRSYTNCCTTTEDGQWLERERFGKLSGPVKWKKIQMSSIIKVL